MKSSHKFKILFRFISIVFIPLMLDSCTQSRSNEIKDFAKINTIKTPEVVKAGPPVIIQLDTCPPPYYAIMPVKDSVMHIYNTSQGPYPVKLGPPTVIPGDFFITMPNYNVEKGLALNSVMSSYCDSKGTLWFGTHGGGVTRYDGNTSETFATAEGLGSNDVRSIVEDKHGNMWFGLLGGGLAKYDGKTIRNFTTKDGLIDDEVYNLLIDRRGNIWVGTNNKGISYFDGIKFTNYHVGTGLPGNKIRCSVEDKDGNIWFGTEDIGVIKYDGKQFVKFSTSEGLVSNNITCILEDKAGNLWFGTRGGISKYDGHTFFNIKEGKGLTQNSVHSIAEDNQGNIWFGTYTGGVICYDGRSFININEKQGLHHNIILNIIKDRSGNLWLGTYGEGVDCYTGRSVTSFTRNEGLSDNKIWGVTEDSNNNLWFATDAHGICKFDNKNFTHYTPAQGLYGRNVSCTLEDKNGNFWFGTHSGVSFFDGRSFTSYTTRHGLADQHVYCIIQARSGNIWFATGAGISEFDGKKFYNYDTRQGLPSNDVKVILESEKGGFWISIHGGGISYFNGRTFTNLSIEQGLTSKFVFTLIKDKYGNIWIGTGENGISILHKKDVERIEAGLEIETDHPLFENITTKEGLSNDAAYGVVEDSLGNIIVGTNLGLTVIKNGLPPSQLTINKSQMEYYNWKVGYDIKDINGQSMYVDSKGYVWVGIGQKLIKFDYSAVHKNPDPPAVHIKTLKVNNEEIGWYNLLTALVSKNIDSAGKKQLQQSVIIEESMIYGKIQDQKLRDSVKEKFRDIIFDSITPFYPMPQNLVLPYKNNSVTFGFSAIEEARPGQVQYQYMLKNYDRDWSPITDQTSATFGNIREGVYHFKVKAKSPDGIWSEPLEYTFRVLPPWWRTKLAYALYIMSFIGLLYTGIQLRVTWVRNKERERANHEKKVLELEAKALRAQMNPHFVFNCLNSIKSLIQQHDEERAVTYLTTFSKLIRNLFNNADKKDISLYDEIETCKLYLQLEAMRFDTKFSYAVNVDEDIDLKSIQIPALIIQPFIENAIWHGIVPRNSGGNVSLNVIHKDGSIDIAIDDNGIGREASAQNKPASGFTHQSKGVNLTQTRLELNNLLQQRQAKLEIIDKKDENGMAMGTTVIIKIKEELS